MIRIVECPRDAMQGMDRFVPTGKKAEYINALLKAGFHTIDFGSFVSPAAIPQMRDTSEVTEKLEKTGSTKLLAIVANVRGAREALVHDKIDQLGFPFSISETFQQRNTNSTIAGGFERVKRIKELCDEKKRMLVIYISMAFGNPYGDPWNLDVVENWVEEMVELGIKTISFADTVGLAKEKDIEYVFSGLTGKFPGVEFGAHLHSRPENMELKIDAAYSQGCRRFDSAMKGFGGCPMAGDELVGNLDTLKVIQVFEKKGEETGIKMDELEKALELASGIFY